ncbi:MAG: glutamate--tRNA ligase, partial [Fusobacteriaceae bacterium]
KKAIRLFASKIEACPEDEISLETAKAMLTDTLAEIGEGPGKVYMPLRAVLTGLPKGADLYNIVFIIGKERTLNRINHMIEQYKI